MTTRDKAGTEEMIQQDEPTILKYSDKFVRIYSNYTNLESGPFDFVFTFGEGKPSKIDALVDVTMSPQHAKALFEILKRQIEHFESKIGEITLPPQKEANRG